MFKQFGKNINNKIIRCTAGIDCFNINHFGNVNKCNTGPIHNKECILGTIEYFIENYDTIIEKNINNPICKNMCCQEDCESYFIEVWKGKNKIWDKVIWKDKIKTIEDININNAWLMFSFTSKCINSCPYCVINYNRKKDIKLSNIEFIDYNSTCNLLEFIAKKRTGIKWMEVVGGGDAQVHPMFSEIINHAIKLGYRINIITSGLLYQERLLAFNSYKNVSFSISLHPSSKNWNETKIRQLIENLKEKKPLNIITTVVKHESNIKYLKNLNDMCKEYNISYFERYCK